LKLKENLFGNSTLFNNIKHKKNHRVFSKSIKINNVPQKCYAATAIFKICSAMSLRKKSKNRMSNKFTKLISFLPLHMFWVFTNAINKGLRRNFTMTNSINSREQGESVKNMKRKVNKKKRNRERETEI